MEAEYSRCFAAAVKWAVSKKRAPPSALWVKPSRVRFQQSQSPAANQVDVDQEPLPEPQRPSRTMAALESASPWLKAQADVYHMALSSLCAKELEVGCPTTLLPYRVADIGQRCDRGFYTIDGSLGTFASSSSLFDFERESFFSNEELFAVMGFDVVDFKGLSAGEVVDLLGNAMATPPLVQVLLPVLKALGYLKDQRGGQKSAAHVK